MWALYGLGAAALVMTVVNTKKFRESFQTSVEAGHSPPLTSEESDKQVGTAISIFNAMCGGVIVIILCVVLKGMGFGIIELFIFIPVLVVLCMLMNIASSLLGKITR